MCGFGKFAPFLAKTEAFDYPTPLKSAKPLSGNYCLSENGTGASRPCSSNVFRVFYSEPVPVFG